MVRLTHNNKATLTKLAAANPPTAQRQRKRIVTQVVLGTIYGVVAFVLVFHFQWIYRNGVSDYAAIQAHNHLSLLSTASPLPVNPPPIPSQLDDNDVAITNHTILLTRRPTKPIVVAYAISLIKCGDHQSKATDLIDAAIVLRHSIHQTSHRVGKSQYDYKMYAIVETGATPCSQVLADLGFELIVRDTPVHSHDIEGEYLQKNIKKAWCCGAREFVKLYAYSLTQQPLVVHLDVDFVMHQPMDTLFDVLLFDKNSVIGQRARAKLEVERTQTPNQIISLPDRPQAALTRDWGQVIPQEGQIPLYQAGFLAARTNPHVLQQVTDIIRKGHYTKSAGWGNLGYGKYLGAMAMQGLMAYYYDQHAAGEWIELNQCRYNHMGMDTKFRCPPNYSDRYERLYGKCRNNSPYCEDCMTTSVEKIYNVHYTQCRKPWLCIGQGNEHIQDKPPLKRSALEKALIPVGSVLVDHCLELAKIWHNHRTDLETKLNKLVSDDSVSWGRNGTYMAHVFQGHCSELGPKGYLAVGGKSENLQLVHQIYD